MAPPYQPMKSMTLYQLIPRKELKLSASHYIINKHQDQLVVDALTRAQYGYCTHRQAARLFEKLFEHVNIYRSKRHTMGRGVYWYKVTEAWEESNQVQLDEDVVRALVLAITLAERRWAGEKSVDTHPFLHNVRLMNDYFVRFEYHSDEAHEILAEFEYARRAQNAFSAVQRFRVPWQSMEVVDTFDIENALTTMRLDSDEPGLTTMSDVLAGVKALVEEADNIDSDDEDFGCSDKDEEDASKPMSKRQKERARARAREEKKELEELEAMFEKYEEIGESDGQEEDGDDHYDSRAGDGDGGPVMDADATAQDGQATPQPGTKRSSSPEQDECRAAKRTRPTVPLVAWPPK
ncbi:hypothetical protein GE09DRAFT_1050102 [Coniochaeta sp. 2T2.1]|nr:hypothetical protein GE09DRAFT_1050102 [Coniochaeta sp. 2T2.1]